MSNGDAIRSMTDEELAKVIGICTVYDTELKIHKCKEYNRCYDCLLDWLKEEAKE